MQGLRGRGNLFKPPNVEKGLATLRRTSDWTGPPRRMSSANDKEVLQQRLEELLIFELKSTGEKQLLHLSVRGLYRYVLDAITFKGPGVVPSPTRGAEGGQDEKILRGSLADSLGETLQSPTPLGHAFVSSEASHVSSMRSHHPLESHGQLPEEEGDVGAEDATVDRRPERRRTESMGSVERPSRRNFARDRRASSGMSRQAVTYRDRLGGYLHPRDMRRLVTPFSASNEPELIVRRHAMLINFDPMRAIVLRDRLLVIMPEGEEDIPERLERILNGGRSANDDFFTNNSGANDNSLYGLSSGNELLTASKAKKTILGMLMKNVSSTPKDRKDSDGEPYKDVDASTQAVVHSEATEETESALDDLEGDDDSEDDEWEEMKGRGWVDLPFELQCLDAVLACVTEILSEDTIELQNASLEYIQHLIKQKRLAEDPLTIIRAVKDAVSEMKSRVKGFVQAITRTLADYEDMTLMNLSRLITHPEIFIQPVPPEVLEEESDEPELILESHLQVGLSLTNALDLIQGQVETAAELVDQKLDSIRNKILLANMILTVFTLCLTLYSLVGSIFGMNLPNPREQDPDAFLEVTFGTLCGCVALFFVILAVLWYSGTIPGPRISGFND